MCRMVAFPTGDALLARRLLAALRGQAAGSANGPVDGRTHAHGWGVLTARSGRLAYAGRSPTDASRDAAFDAAIEAAAAAGPGGFILGHVRNASTGGVALSNTHPFVRAGWAFCHNGTIQDARRIEQAEVRYEGETDSERYFSLILTHLRRGADPPEAIRRAADEVAARTAFSSLTCLLTDGDRLFAYRRVGTLLDGCDSRDGLCRYYTVAVATVDGARAVAQEPTGLGPIEDWAEVPDGGVVVWDAGKGPRIVARAGTPAQASRAMM